MSNVISIEFEDGEELAIRLKRLADDVSLRVMRGALRAGGAVTKDEMVRRAPVGGTRPTHRFEHMTKIHIGGRLRDSITVRTHSPKTADDVAVSIGPRVWYARLLHTGHRIRVPPKGVGAWFIWGKYWAQGMQRQFLPQSVPGNTFVADSLEVTKEGVIQRCLDYVQRSLRRYELRRGVRR